MTSEQIIDALELIEGYMNAGNRMDATNELISSLNSIDAALDTVKWMDEHEEHILFMASVNVCAEEPYCTYEEALDGFNWDYDTHYQIVLKDSMYYFEAGKLGGFNKPFTTTTEPISHLPSEARAYWDEHSYALMDL